MIIHEYINILIEEKREEIISEGINIKKGIESTNSYKIYTFKKLYKIAKQTKEEKDIDNAIKYYESNKMTNYHIRSLENLYNELLYYKKFAYRNGKKITISEIESHLKKIIEKFSNNPKCIRDCTKYDVDLVCELLEVYGNNAMFEIIDGDQDVKCEMLDWVHKIGKQLKDELPVNVGYGAGDEGCLYIEF